MGILTHEQARAFYDRLGARQDSQRFYEDAATRELVRHAGFETARAVVEFGCGTGRFAEGLLAERLPAATSYLALDVSTTMVGLARERLGRFGPRVEVRQTDGSPRIDAAPGTFDRFVSNYVLDLLAEPEIHALLAEAHRVLAPQGLLALASLGHGTGPVTRLVERAWTGLHRVRPAWLGGCRPIDLRAFVDAPRWAERHRSVVCRFGLCSEVLVAERRGP